MRLAVLWLVAGCSYKPNVIPPDGDQPGDTSSVTDAPVVLPDAPCSFSTQFDTCVFEPTSSMDPPADQLYDTGTHVLSNLDGTNPVTLGSDRQVDVMGKAGVINVLLVTQFNLPGGRRFRVVGPKAFGIVSTGGITIDGVLDGSSERSPASNPNVNLNGPGSLSAAACGTATPADPGNHVGGAAGGGGGAFQGAGGFGQDSDSNEGGDTGASGGIAAALPNGPRGGCPGGAGGSNTGMGAALSEGGQGGGAIYLVAAGTIDVKGAGKITAGGAGGQGGDDIDGGGAGGGSGGMILLEADTLKIGGLLAANGGGGGGGAGSSGKGGNGGNSNLSDTMAALGGSGFGPGGPGETGSVGSVLKGTDNDNTRPAAGGGGGGGGAGVISLKSTTSPTIAGGAKFSPPTVTLPN
jgi:hypothetical protein